MSNTLVDSALGDVTQINSPIGQETPEPGSFTKLVAQSVSVSGPVTVSGPISVAINPTVAVAATTDTFAEIFSHGLPYVAYILPAERVVVFHRTGSVERFALMAAWPNTSARCRSPRASHERPDNSAGRHPVARWQTLTAIEPAN